MNFDIRIRENSVKNDLICKKEVNNENKNMNIFFIGKGSYVGKLQLLSPFEFTDLDYCHNFQIGRYCSLGNNIKVLLNLNHDYKSVYQGVIEELAEFDSSNKLLARGQMYHRTRKRGQVIIQNDCWIGDNVIILAGVTIHSGAVVGAGAVITKDVPPYAIVVGNPARIIRYRFGDQERKQLLKIAWWDWESRKLNEQKELLQGDIERFIAGNLSEEMNCDRISTERDSDSIRKYLFFIDIEDNYPLHERIIKEFVEKYNQCYTELMIAYDINSMEEEKQIKQLFDELIRYDATCIINFYGVDLDEQYKIFQKADYYITNRSCHNIQRTSLADMYGTKMISGVDLPVFSL